MGLRQPSKTAVFFAQSKTGAQQQKKARDELKKPQALGGSAAAGTQMVAGATQAQQQATGQVQQVTQQASKDLNIEPSKLGSSTVAAIAGTPTATGAPAPTPSTDFEAWRTSTATPGISAPSTTISPDLKVEGKGQSLTGSQIETIGTNIDTAITNATNQLNAINTKIQNASADDLVKLNAEKARLETLLNEYRDKQLNQKLGEVGQSSTLGQEMLERERLLAEEGNNVGKLAALFGGKARQYGGLEAQIYGKDLEAIQESAKAGLEEKELAERQSDVAIKKLGEQIGKSKSQYEQGLKTEQQKLDYLKATPQELKNVSKQEMYNLFGGETAEKLFDFDERGFVSNAETSKVRDAYNKLIADLGTEKLKVKGEKETADKLAAEKFDTYDKELFGDTKSPGKIAEQRSGVSRWNDIGRDIVSKIDDITSTWYKQEWSGISRDKAIAQTIQKKVSDGNKELDKIKQRIDQARKDKNYDNLRAAYNEYETYSNNLTKDIAREAKQLTGNGKALVGLSI